MTIERLTIEQARARIAANTRRDSLVDPNGIDWTQPAREAVTIAGLVQSTDNFEERSRIGACALALLGYQAHLDYAAGQADERANAVALCEQAATRHTRAAEAGFARRRLSGEAIDRVTAKASELRTMAAYIERGDRAEGH